MTTERDGTQGGVEPAASLVHKAKEAAVEIAERAAAADRDRRLPHPDRPEFGRTTHSPSRAGRQTPPCPFPLRT